MTPRKNMPRAMLIALGAALGLASVPHSRADTERDPAPGLTVEAAHIRLSARRQVGSVHFRLDNHGARDLVLLAVRSPLARDNMLLMRQPGLGLVEVEALLVPRNETLDLASSHLRARLGDLVRTLEPGETVPLVLVLRGAEVMTDAHVHVDGENAGGSVDEPTKDHRSDALSRLDRGGGAGG